MPLGLLDLKKFAEIIEDKYARRQEPLETNVDEI